MRRLYFIIIISECLLLAACFKADPAKIESNAKNAIIKKLADSTPSVPSGNVKFVKFTQIDDGHGCFAINVPNHPNADSNGDMQAYINSYDDKKMYVLLLSKAGLEECLENMEYLAKRDVAKKNGTDEAECKKAVLKSLKDPDSAKFGKFTVVGMGKACLAVNARNSLGGYAGEQQALLKVKNNGFEWVFLDFTQVDHESCTKALSSF